MGRVYVGSVFIWFLAFMIAFCARISVSARSEQEIRQRFYGNIVNSSAPDTGEGSIAKMFDRVLEREFSSDNDQPEGWAFFFSSLNLFPYILNIGFSFHYWNLTAQISGLASILELSFI